MEAGDLSSLPDLRRRQARYAAIEMHNKGVEVINAKKDQNYQQQAFQLFASACHADPTFAQGFFQAGNNDGDLNLYLASIACYRRALECNPDPDLRSKILTNLGWRLHCVGQVEEARAVSIQALDLFQSNKAKRDIETLTAIWINLSCVHGIRNDLDLALTSARMAYELSPNDSTAEMALAFALLFKREFKEGFERFEGRFRYKLKEYLNYPYPKWDGIPGKTLYLCADQGLGDTISFARFVRQTCQVSKYVHCRIQPELMRLFSHAFVDISNLNLIPQPCAFPQADAWTTFVSLPYALSLSNEEFRNAPQIALPRFANKSTWKLPDRKFHIGIAWGGSPLNDIDKHRNIPVHHFLELLRVPGIQLYALQVGDRAKDMHDIGAAPFIKDMSRYIQDVSDTIALLNELDLVISVESALPHICALAGKECWVPYSYLGRDYRLGSDASDMIWTSKHRVFQQSSDQKWEPVFERIVEALRECVHGQKA